MAYNVIVRHSYHIIMDSFMSFNAIIRTADRDVVGTTSLSGFLVHTVTTKLNTQSQQYMLGTTVHGHVVHHQHSITDITQCVVLAYLSHQTALRPYKTCRDVS